MFKSHTRRLESSKQDKRSKMNIFIVKMSMLMSGYLQFFVVVVASSFFAAQMTSRTVYVAAFTTPIIRTTNNRFFSETELFFESKSTRRRHQYQDQLSNSTTAYEILKKGDGDPTKLTTSIDGGRRSSNIDNSGGSSSTELQSSYSAAVTSSFTNKPLISATNTDGFKIYCDLDGCLVNFEKGVQVLLNKPTSNLDKRTMWDQISQVPNWFEKLEWTMDGKRLWRAIQHLNPDILTGVPDIESSRVDKLNWCMRELDLNDANHVDMAAEGLEIVSMDTGLESSSSSNNNNDRNYWDDSNHGSSLWIDDHKSINGNLPRKDKTNIITCWSNNKYKECRIGS